MDAFPIFDYAPSTLLGIAVLAVLFGWLVPYRVVKAKDAEIAFLRSTNTTQAEALDQALETSKVVRRLFEGLEDGAR